LAVSVHDVQRQKGILFKPWEAWQLKRIYRRADVLFVHGENQAQDLVNFAGVDRTRVHVVPHGPYKYPAANESREETRSRLGIPGNANVGLAFGLVRDEKNYDRLIEALVHQPPDVHLLVAGNDVPKHRPHRHYQRLTERLGVDDRVHFVSGFIPDEDVGNLFQASDWAALTYSLSFTSQSGVLNSAVQFGLPVLATPTAALSESLASFPIGVVCQSDSSAAISCGIDMITKLLPESGQLDFDTYLQDNSWQRNAKLTLNAYRKSIEGAAD
jgi:glycosyltransferase involved in cell wall biosynthesis